MNFVVDSNTQKQVRIRLVQDDNDVNIMVNDEIVAWFKGNTDELVLSQADLRKQNIKSRDSQ